jgi:hypothetical protein
MVGEIVRTSVRVIQYFNYTQVVLRYLSGNYQVIPTRQ